MISVFSTRLRRVAFVAGILAGLFGGDFARGADSQVTPSLDEVLRGYAGLGDIFTVALDYAPFPHPARSAGFKHETDFYRAETHYHDPRVGVFIPKGFRESGPVDLVVYFHGWSTSLKAMLPTFKVIEQFAASGRNALLVMPQGPREAPDSFGGKLEDPGGFRKFVQELMETLQEQKKLKTLEVGRIILAGHSGGYQVMASILDHGGVTNKIQEVYLFDALYGQAEKFGAWLGEGQGRLRVIYTPYGGTRSRTEDFFVELTAQKRAPVMKKETEVTPSVLATNRVVFITSDWSHEEVVFKGNALADFLKASGLREIAAPK